MPGIPAFRRLKQDSHRQAPSQKTDSEAAATCCVWGCNHKHLGGKGGGSQVQGHSQLPGKFKVREREREKGGREGETLPQTNRTTTNSFHEHTGNMVLFPAPLAAQYETLRNKRAHILGRCVLPEASI